MFDHLSAQDLYVCLFGILMFWFFRFSSDKDEIDNELSIDKDISTAEKQTRLRDFNRKWIRIWILYKWDNIFCHILASLLFLYLGEENLEAWLGDIATRLPQGANQIGSAAVIGYFGSFIAEGLKKLIKLIKT
ncbi:hypothetical protein [Marinoscillum furvescens]|uniref:Uncharacterized protein n=1 Tax=Marinoscillum furvescens DSM 4134 TaxID=1122208 RepID=A0A3D9L6Z4_MARFU|nr:hypothetical protein [Marinoscillum furvescens]REE01118.1 hypothetical protein C7460_104138 [Marinoscillum furvescens DSM 4134]